MLTNAAAKLEKLRAKIKPLRALSSRTLDEELKLSTARNTKKILLKQLDRLHREFEREFGHK